MSGVGLRTTSGMITQIRLGLNHSFKKFQQPSNTDIFPCPPLLIHCFISKGISDDALNPKFEDTRGQRPKYMWSGVTFKHVEKRYP